MTQPVNSPLKNAVPDRKKGHNLLDLRDVNLNVLLSAIWEHAPIPRVELAQRTGLSSSSITRLIRQLSAKGLITETGKGRSSGGRQPILIEPNPGAGVIVCLDFSGSHLRAGIFDAANRVIREVERPFAGLGEASIRQQMLATAHQLLQDPLVSGRQLLGLGVSSPSVFHGEVHFSHTLKLRNFPIQAILEDAFHVPVIVQNDSHVAALAEKYYGAGRELEDFIYLLLSDGIGAGLILNGDIYTGSLEMAGEIGHTIVDRRGVICGCGKRGCLETMATRAAILSHAQRVLDYEQDEILAGLIDPQQPGLTLAMLREAAERGSAAALEVIDFAANYIGYAVVNATTILGIHAIIVGGEVAQTLGRPFMASFTRAVAEYNRGFQPIELIAAQLDWRAFLQAISMLTLQEIIGIDL